MGDKDTIYRQAAIDAAIKADMENNNGILSEKRARVFAEYISSLPSAQPEILACGEGELNVFNTNVIDCSDCIKHGGDWDCDHVHCHKGKSVQPKRKGKWIVDDMATEHCSVCKHRFYISALFAVGGNDEPPCCPNCGVRME